MEKLNLFVFGAGYSANAAIAAIRNRTQAAVAATTRDDQKAEQLEAQGVTAHIFDGDHPGRTLEKDLAAATHLLVSIAPNAEGDPVLRHHAHAIRKARNLTWIGYYSTIGVYGDAQGNWIDETASAQPLSARNRYRLDAEAGWQALARDMDVPLAILRLAGIYGPGRSPFDKLKKGTARRLDKPGQVFNRIHRDDIAALTARAAERRLAGIYNICDDEPAPPQVVIAHAAEMMGVPVAFQDADLSPMARTFYAGNRRVSNRAIKSALDYTLAFPTYREGHRAILTQERD